MRLYAVTRAQMMSTTYKFNKYAKKYSGSRNKRKRLLKKKKKAINLSATTKARSRKFL